MGTERTREIDSAASDWLIRRDSGVWSAADQAQLDEWLNASTLNRVAFLRLELSWEDAARLKALGAGIADDRPPPPERWNLTPFYDPQVASASEDWPSRPEADDLNPIFEGNAPRARPDNNSASAESSAVTDSESHCVKRERRSFLRRSRQLAVAAMLLIAVAVSAYRVLAPSGDRYDTPVGGFASVPMADGSRVTLNTDSQIRISLNKVERDVDLRHGEAFFEVSKDANRPFIVRAGDKRVIAVGTKFSVRRDGDDIEVVVTEGKVRVQDGAGREASNANGSADVFLTPGSIARAGEAGVLVQRRTLSEAEEQLSWRTGVLTFRDRSLLDAVAEFNRYNKRKIVIQDPAIASLKIEGNFHATNADAFVRLLLSGFPVRADSQPDKIVLMSK